MSYDKFREGDRVARHASGSGALGRVEAAISEGLATIRWDDGTSTNELIGDVRFLRGADEQAAIERRVRAIQRHGVTGLVQVMRENGDPMADHLERIAREFGGEA